MAAELAHAEPAYAKFMRDSKASSPFWLADIEKNLTPESRDLLEKYSGVAPEDVNTHIHNIRDKAWEIRAYPCTGLGRWLAPNVSRLPHYSSIIEQLKGGDKFMDVGCYMGTDLRRLAFDGAPTDNLYAVDIVSHWDLGYELFRDRDRFSAHFIEADINSADPALALLHGAVGVICINHVLHQWTWEDQVKTCKSLVAFSKPGTRVVGFQMGNVQAHEKSMSGVPVDRAHRQWRHSPESFGKMWDQVSNETNTRWETQAWLWTWEEIGWDSKDNNFLEEGCRYLGFMVTRTGEP